MKVEMNIKRTYKYCIVLACAIIMFSFLLSPLTLKAQERPKVAVVLSGGGAKGVAHISALRAIEEAGLPIDIICGTSMGALVGGLYCTGWSVEEMDSLVRHQDWTSLLTDRARPEDLDVDTRKRLGAYLLWHAFSLSGSRNEGAGFFRGVNLDRLFDRLLQGYRDSIDFNDLPIPFACVATDIITNTEIDFHRGHLKEAMRASMAIPGVFAPVRRGDMLLVDGSMRNNFPSDIARKMGADIIIGVTVQDDTLNADAIRSPIGLFMQILDINTRNKYKDNLALCDIIIQVNVTGYSGASFTEEAIDTLLRRGAEAAALHRDELVDLRHRLEAHCGEWDTCHHSSSSTHTSSFDENKITSLSPMLTNPIAGVTFRFDNEETGALQIGTIYPYFWHIPMELNARLRLGKRLQFSIENMCYPRGVTSPSISYSFQRNDIDFYNNGVRNFSIKYTQHIVDFAPINSRFRKYKIKAGLRYDYYNYYDPILAAAETAPDLNNQHFFSYYFESILNTENNLYFPTSGNQILATLAYRADNFTSLNNHTGLIDASFNWRINLTMGRRFTFQPVIFTRLLSGKNIPLAYVNVLGTRQSLVKQQIDFPGVHSLVMTNPFIVGAQFNFQFLIATKRYILIRSAAARHLSDIKNFLDYNIDLKSSQFLYGVSLGYAHNSFLGPIEVHLGYSNLAPGLNFYLNIGHSF